MTCAEVQSQLGEFLDNELPEPQRAAIDTHLQSCRQCRDDLDALRSLAAAVSAPPRAAAPRTELWTAIERRLAAPAVQAHDPGASRLRLWLGWRPLASAAAILVAIGLAWMFVSGPGSEPAIAARIDFRPLLEQADGDIEAGIRALIAAHGGGKIDLAEAQRKIHLRVHAPGELPGGLVQRGLYLLNLGGDHHSLAFHYSGSAGQLLLLQCPPTVQRNYGGQECIACEINSTKGEIVRSGRLRLAHFASDNVCVCVVSTLDEPQLAAALKAVQIDY